MVWLLKIQVVWLLESHNSNPVASFLQPSQVFARRSLGQVEDYKGGRLLGTARGGRTIHGVKHGEASETVFKWFHVLLMCVFFFGMSTFS